ncbi:MAG: class I SAM-dependent methyltransferase [Sphingobacteriia bacterium]|nr:class I SAM-dependent methyltransferase [Sphingobacteriia bacterium]NCC40386.1 class I SAM-dependent methyltransferase [Gammaproteobacteria bacterium]
MTERKGERTIADFGDQWVRFTDNSGYYGSPELFADLLSPLLDPADVAGQRVADIGSGSGRIVGMLLAAGAAHVTAIEPSRAFEVLSERFAGESRRVTCHRLAGAEIGTLGPFDLVVSLGVLHHIPDPAPVVAAAHAALRPGGRCFIWLYGREGNELYLALVRPLRAITTRLPDPVLEGLVRAIDLPLAAYIRLCRVMPLPMRAYMRDHLGRLDPDKRRLTIFDQLNPAYAKYYTHEEAHDLLANAGFVDIALHHRHGYSWSLVGTRP